jgi:translation initiation factor IF-3
LMQKVKGDLNTMAQVEMEPKHMGKSINMTLSPLPAAKRKRRFADGSTEETPDTEDEPDEDEDDDEESAE